MADSGTVAASELLKDWHTRVHKLEKAHFRSASACRNFNYVLGSPLVILTSVVASEVYEAVRLYAIEQYPWNGIEGAKSLNGTGAETPPVDTD